MPSLPRRPLAGITIFFAAGTCLGLVCGTPSVLPLMAGAIFLAINIIGANIGRLSFLVTPALLAAILATGWTHAAMSLEDRPAPITRFALSSSQGIGILGVADDNGTRIGAASNRVTWKVRIACEQVRLSSTSSWHRASGPVWVRFHLPDTFQPPHYGERWAFSGYLETLTNAPATRIPPAYLSAGRSAHRISRGHGNPVIRFAVNAREHALAILTEGITSFPEEAAILNSLLLGVRGQVPREIYQSFASTSTLHVFAISGSHVVILAGVLIPALSACRIPRTRWILALAPVLLLYTIMTGLQSSATRACIMAILFWSAPLMGRKPDVYASLGAAAILLLAWDPTELADAGFLLSFVAVLGLALFTPVLLSPLQRILHRDPLQLQPSPPWESALRQVGLAFCGLVAMTISAAVVSAPLTAHYFGSVSPIGLLGNLLAVPLASLIILTGALSLALGSLTLLLADVFNHANVALALLLRHFIAFLASIPGGHWTIQPLPLWGVALSYGCLIVTRFLLWTRPTVQPPHAPQD